MQDKKLNNISVSNNNVTMFDQHRIASIESMKKLNALNAVDVDNNPAMLIRKSILKQLSRDAQKSMNETTSNISDTFNNNDLPTESTPKANDGSVVYNTINNRPEVRFKNGNNETNKDDSAIDINLKEVALMNSEDLERFMQTLLDKKKNNVVDLDADKSKLYDKKPINNAFSIDMETNGKQQMVNAATNTSILSKLEDDFKKLNNEEKDDILGYLKMYKKTNRLCIQQMPTNEQWSLKVFIDGPYETTSRDIFDSEHVVLIAAGIGITPYASILQSIMQRFKKTKNICPSCDHSWELESHSGCKGSSIKKVDFIWVTRDQRSLEWFISMLSQMEIDQKKNNQNFLETHLYVTSAHRQTDLKSIGLHMTLDVIYSEEDSRFIEGLKKRTHYGRPNWDTVFQQLIRKQEGKISVFFCGPPSLSDLLQDKCTAYNLTFKKELF